MPRDVLRAGDLRAGTTTPRAKLKFDRQIIAIARVHNQTAIYSDDDDIAKLADPLEVQDARADRGEARRRGVRASG